MRTIAGIVAWAAIAAASPACAEVTASSDAGFVVRETVTIDRSPLEVWAELIAPAHWWDKAHTWSQDAVNLYIDPQATGCFCELLPQDPAAPQGTRRGSVEHMHVIHANPGKLLLMSGGLGPLQSEAVNAKLAITLEAKDGATTVTWEYVVGGTMRTKPDQIAPAVDKVLGEQLAHLADRFAAAPAPDPAKEPK